MNFNNITLYKSAAKLPDDWDEAADNPFMKKEILKILEACNPCGQMYYKLGKIVFVTFCLKINVLTYGFAKMTVPATILGVPASISCAGHNSSLNRDILAFLSGLPGLKLVLNTRKPLPGKGFLSGHTLPSAVLHNHWKTFDDYLGAMRSPYRYRIKKALNRGQEFTREQIDAPCFDKTLYDLYLNVYQRSSFKLEKLSMKFFQTFPGVIIKFGFKGKPVAFVQLYEDKNRLYFMFGGMAYQYVKSHDLYLNMLIEIVGYGIENGYQQIELGQTAQEIKQKLGAVCHDKYMMFTHSNKAVYFLGKLFRTTLVYRENFPQFHVFKRTGG